MFILGAAIGGYIATHYMTSEGGVQLSEATKENVLSYGLTSWRNGIVPTEFFNWGNLFHVQGLIMMVLGGFLIGFGSRYSGGCTSGHAISGLANLQLPSLVAVIGFFIGGLFVTWFVLPYLLSM